MSNLYSLVFQNNSESTWTAALYQPPPDGLQQAVPLAWLTGAAAAAANVTFQWQPGYSFVWAKTGELATGVHFYGSQYLAADPNGGNNQVTLTCAPPFKFRQQIAGPVAGTLFIQQDHTIPVGTAAVGVAMGGAGIYVVQAQPNILTSFIPRPQYWIAVGDYTAGEVIDPEVVPAATQVEFPANVYSMTAILNDDNTWTVKQTSAVNEELIAARKKNRRARWGAAG